MRADRGAEGNLVFEDVEDRHAFISKVLTILAVMLAITAATVALFMFNEDVRDWFLERAWIMWIAIFVTLFCVIRLSCCMTCARTVPLNYILLFTFTIFKSILVGYLAIMFRPFLVLVAFGVTCAVVFALAAFACQTRIDFTVCYGAVIALVIILLVLTIVCLFFPSRTLMLIICGFGIFAFSIFLIIDIQMMVGGTHKNQYSEEDYVVAALAIYIDIINIFMYILILLGLLDDG